VILCASLELTGKNLDRMYIAAFCYARLVFQDFGFGGFFLTPRGLPAARTKSTGLSGQSGLPSVNLSFSWTKRQHTYYDYYRKLHVHGRQPIFRDKEPLQGVACAGAA